MAKQRFYKTVCDKCGVESTNVARLSVNNSRIRPVDLCDQHVAPLLDLLGAAKPARRRGVGDMAFVSPGDVESGKVGTRRGRNTPLTAPETALGTTNVASVGDRT